MWKPLAALLLLLTLASAVRGQNTITAFLSQVDSYFRLSSNVRLIFQGKGYMEDGDLNHAQIGPSLRATTYCSRLITVARRWQWFT